MLMADTAAGVRDTGALLSFIRDGGQPGYLLFWGHQPSPGGDVGKECLSQWWPAAFSVDGVTYPSAEHFMMAAKAQMFGDTQTAELILAAPNPRAAKALGRQTRGFDEQRWAWARFDVVVAGNVAKFGQHPELLEYLLSTGNLILVEASPLDSIWGIGLSADDDRATSPEHWEGKNLLGFALMEVRHRARVAAGT
jgi:ribA/ribD-fused uncharacterized protein